MYHLTWIAFMEPQLLKHLEKILWKNKFFTVNDTLKKLNIFFCNVCIYNRCVTTTQVSIDISLFKQKLNELVIVEKKEC